ncbi:pentapeptide repeat-containing protein [Microbispora siamensis]|nr:pentapeptide repeat-containing protein [Microbispora siamensis]
MVLTALQAERDAAFAERDAERDAAHAERVAEDSQRDALERRITELYTKAAEQLGHAKAAVRLAGMYALERLAQDNEGHRQTIVNVICAYLRMPYSPPTPSDPEQERREALRAARRRYHAARNGHSGVTQRADQSGQAGDPEGEQQVRLTAQRILAEHLRDDRSADERETIPLSPRFWGGMRIDLTGATLIDFDFSHCRAAAGVFNGTTFYGTARFNCVAFSGEAIFSKATFSEEAWFDEATFSERASFSRATFSGEAWFEEATFSGRTYFIDVAFSRAALFSEATFTDGATFSKATFTGRALFSEATFTGGAIFSKATFTGETAFKDTVGPIHLKGARVTNPAERHQWPPGWHVVKQPDGSGLLESASDRQPPEADDPEAGAGLSPE